MLKIAYFLALECSNRAHSDLDKLMKALFFIRGRWPSLEAAGRGMAVMAPSPGAGSPAPASAPSPAGGVESSSAGRAPFSPAAGAGAAGACRGAGGASAALLNSSPLLRCTLQAHDVDIEAFWKNRCKIRLR